MRSALVQGIITAVGFSAYTVVLALFALSALYWPSFAGVTHVMLRKLPSASQNVL